MDFDHRLAASEGQLMRLAQEVRRAGSEDVVAYDTETSGLFPYYGDYLTGFSIVHIQPGAQRAVGYYVPVAHKQHNASSYGVNALLDALTYTNAQHVLHHANFDFAFLENMGGYGRPAHTKLWDTQVMRWLTDENMRQGLKTIGQQYLGEDAGEEQRALKAYMKGPYATQTDAYKHVRASFPELPVAEARAMARRMRAPSGWADIPASVMAPYAARDATLTYEVRELFRSQVSHTVLAREQHVADICYRMTRKGTSVDIEKLHSAAKTYRQRAEELERDFNTNHRVTNPGSNDQIAHLLYDEMGLPIMGRTPGGAPSVGKNVLEQLQGHPVVAKVLGYRHWIKAASAYAEPWAAFAERSVDGRLHGHYSTTRTVTGRLAASDPNVMTIPRHEQLPEVREAFYTAPPGMERVGFDIVSAELWVTASITGDPVLTSALLEGRNLHLETMLAIFGGEPDKERREYTLSKNVNYGSLYEAGVGALSVFAAKAGYSPKEARNVAFRARDAHRSLFKRQHFVADYLARKADELGRLPLHVPGRYRHFKSPGAWVEAYTALNAMVQGGVAEFMKDTMIELDIAGWADSLVLQVHDELVADVPIGEGAKLHKLLNQIAQDINPFKYPLKWDAKAWG